jgi:uncharacterized membrane protein
MMNPNRTAWISALGLVLLVTMISGHWSLPTSESPHWKTDIQMPGIVVVLVAGLVIGPLAAALNPPVICVLTILTNTVAYYSVIRVFAFFWRREAVESSSPPALFSRTGLRGRM